MCPWLCPVLVITVLTGRPYGGCAILWRKNLSLTASPITSNSRRISAVLFCGAGVRFVCLCIYMPYESDFSSTEEFQFQLSAVDTIISQHQDAHIILVISLYNVIHPLT